MALSTAILPYREIISFLIASRERLKWFNYYDIVYINQVILLFPFTFSPLIIDNCVISSVNFHFGPLAQLCHHHWVEMCKIVKSAYELLFPLTTYIDIV